MAFHWKDGWFFERQPDGSVRMFKRESAREDAPIVIEAMIDADSWASVVASVSVFGEDCGRWYIARAFHNAAVR